MKKFFSGLNKRLKVVRELLQFLWEYKIWWMAPIVIVLLLVAGLVIFTINNPTAVPFVYTLF